MNKVNAGTMKESGASGALAGSRTPVKPPKKVAPRVRFIHQGDGTDDESQDDGSDNKSAPSKKKSAMKKKSSPKKSKPKASGKAKSKAKTKK